MTAAVLSASLYAADSGDTGKIIAKWDFSKGLDSVSGGITCKARGGTKIVDGALETGLSDKRSEEGLAIIGKHPELTPHGAFVMKVSFELKPPTSAQPYLFFWDSKCDFYDKGNNNPRDNSGFTFGLHRIDGAKGVYQPAAWLGFGKKTALAEGGKITLKTGVKYLLAFGYDGIGKVDFSLDGKLISSVNVKHGGPIAPACFNPVIGDRTLAHFFRFDGRVFSVELIARKTVPIKITTSGRGAFVRNERGAEIVLNVRNVTSKPVENVLLRSSAEKRIGTLAPHSEKKISVPIETRLKTGPASMSIDANYVYCGVKESAKYSLEYRIAPIQGDFIPVAMWDYCDSFEILKKTGFTHGISSLAAGIHYNKDDRERIARGIKRLDNMLCAGFFQGDYFCIPHFQDVAEKYPRIDRNGKPIKVRNKFNMDANNPAVKNLLSATAELTAAAYAAHPALDMVDLNSEIRDRSTPSFSVYETEKFKIFSSRDVPARIDSKVSSWRNFPDFPDFGVINENYTPYVYFLWFWKDGDGWNPMHKTIGDIYHKHAAPRKLNTYFAPAARQPPVWGIAGKVDVVSQWTYAYPDPLCITSAVDEVLAMAAEIPGKKIMEGIQFICYRSQTAPENVKPVPEPAWLAENKNAKYITIPPDSLAEALWCLFSRRLDGYVFHGDGALYSDPKIKKTPGYICTNPKAEKVFANIIENVVKPLGPLFKRIPERKRDIAILHSFASAVFAGRGSYGLGGTLMDLHLALQWAGLDPRVIYEEEILRNNLEGIKVLFMPHCDMLPSKVIASVNEFQRRGGIVFADQFCTPAVIPSFQLENIRRNPADAGASKLIMQKTGFSIRKQLAPYYSPFASSNNSDIITHVRSFGSSDYLFAINDKRAFGDYFGPWKMTQEKGLPNSGAVAIKRKTGAAYDLTARKAVNFTCKNGETFIPVSFTTNDGRVFALLDEPAAAPELSLPRFIERGNISRLNVRFNGVSGKPLQALTPFELTIANTAKEVIDGSGFFCAENGSFNFEIQPALNEAPGKWTITIRSLFDGKTVSANVNLI